MSNKYDTTKVGTRFGKLVMTSEPRIHKDKNGKGRYAADFLCECGKIKTIRLDAVHSGRSSSCGCMSGTLGMVFKTNIPAIGTKTNMLTLLSIERKMGKRVKKYIGTYLCDCGNKKEIPLQSVITEHTKSCGCYHKPLNSDQLPTEVYTLLDRYKRGAKKRNLSYTLTNEQFLTLTSSNCHYCNSMPSQKIERHIAKVYTYNGIDRIDNSIGYEYNNCVSSCAKCNSMKTDYKVEDFLKHINKIHTYMSRA